MIIWDAINFESTIRDFDYTRRAVSQMYSKVYSADFEDKDSETIFYYLLREMELISFKDYLRRYIYEAAEIEMPFRKVTDDIYREIIMNSFEENMAPHSFEPTSKKWSSIVKSWLTQDCVKRDTVFLLGFGLRMEPEDVSEFLTKVLKEEDFRLKNPREVVFWYCYRNALPYSRALTLLKRYENMEIASGDDIAESGSLSETAASGKWSPDQIRDEAELDEYLSRLKKSGSYEGRQIRALSNYQQLLNRAMEIIVSIYQKDENEKDRPRKWDKTMITYGDIEKMIFSGVPVTANGNLQKMSSSLLNRHFAQKRLTRQRINTLIKKQTPVERFDLLTMLFFIFSQDQAELEPEIRFRNYLDEANRILKDSGMMEVYPVNPYETFLLMCLLSEDPLPTYADIWEMSYTEE